MDQIFLENSSLNASVNVNDFVISLVTAIILGLLTTQHFKRIPTTVSSKGNLIILLPFIALVVCIIITIVKSSLALSLGLVGALSIVRFRTPIKDPMELSYIFLAIAIGLGTGAGQLLTITVGTVFVLVALGIHIKYAKNKKDKGYLSISIEEFNIVDLQNLQALLANQLEYIDMRKFSYEGRRLDMILLSDISNVEHIENITNELHNMYNQVSITVLDTSDLPQV